MPRSFLWQLSVLLLIATAAGAQVDNSNQSSQSSSSPPVDNATPTNPSEAPTAPTTGTPSITVTGKALHSERPLPALPPDEISDCMRDLKGDNEILPIV
jgi:hypothetical protein